MSPLRILSNGRWNKPPILTAARRLLIGGLARLYPARPLGEVATFLNGTSYDVQETSDHASRRIIRISNITDPTSPYVRTSQDLGERFWVRPGDLLVSWSASFKSTIWTGSEGYLNQHIFKVTEKPGYDRRYVRHAIEDSFDEMQEKVVGIGMMHLRRSDFLAHPIPAPPCAVQKAVADYLDHHEYRSIATAPDLPDELSRERRIVARIEEVAEKVEEARNLRSRGEQEAEQLTRQAAALLFPVASGSTVGDFVSFQTGYAFRSEWFSDHGVRLARNVNVGHGGLDWSQTARLPIAQRGEYRRFELQLGDILVSLDRPIISTGAKVAKVGEADLPCLLLQRVARARFVDSSVLPEYFFCWLRSPRFAEAIDPGRSNGVPHISHRDIEKIPFSPPGSPEQHQIVATWGNLDTTIGGLRCLQSETAVEMAALLPTVLDRAFRGCL